MKIDRKKIIEEKRYNIANLETLKKMYKTWLYTEREKELKVILQFINYINFKCISCKIPFFRIMYDFFSSKDLTTLECIFSFEKHGWKMFSPYDKKCNIPTSYMFSNNDIFYDNGYFVDLSIDYNIIKELNCIRNFISNRDFEILIKSSELLIQKLGN